MTGYFERVGGGQGGAAVVLDHAEISILRSFTVQLLELVGPGPGDGAEAGPGDPLDGLFADGPSEPPADPVLARLFPDAYGGPGAPRDEEAQARAAEFRRYTEDELRARKRQDGLAVIRALDALEPEEAGGGAVLRLTPDEARQWLGTLNDLRLAIGTRLEITDDDSTERLLALPAEDPMKPMVLAYLWLGGLQESLVETLME